jgi:hypothetical protein
VDSVCINQHLEDLFQIPSNFSDKCGDLVEINQPGGGAPLASFDIHAKSITYELNLVVICVL